MEDVAESQDRLLDAVMQLNTVVGRLIDLRLERTIEPRQIDIARAALARMDEQSQHKIHSDITANLRDRSSATASDTHSATEESLGLASSLDELLNVARDASDELTGLRIKIEHIAAILQSANRKRVEESQG